MISNTDLQQLFVPEYDEITVAKMTHPKFPNQYKPGTVTYWRSRVAVFQATPEPVLERLRQGWTQEDSACVERSQP